MSAAERLSVPDSSPRLLAVLAQADPVKNGAAVIDQISRLTPDHADPAGMYLIGLAASAVWAYDLGLVFLNAAVDGLRAQGRLGLLAQALTAQAWAAVHTAREPLAVSAAEEGIALARETGQPRLAVTAQLAKAAIAAERGDLAVAEALAREAEALCSRWARPGCSPWSSSSAVAAQWHTSITQRDSSTCGGRLIRTTPPTTRSSVRGGCRISLRLPLIRTGKTQLEAYLGQLESLAAETSGSLLRATAGYARPMLAGDDAAETLYQTAVGSDLANWPCYRGRMLLWYGRWLRRQRRVAESRTRLQSALDAFEALAFPG